MKILFFSFLFLSLNANSFERVDLRSSFQNLMDVEHQGYSRNSCATFAIAAQAQWEHFHKTKMNLAFSKEYIGYLARTKVLIPYPRLQSLYEGVDGMAGFMAAKSLEYGAALESSWQYNPTGLPSPLEPMPLDLKEYDSIAFKTHFIERENIHEFIVNFSRPVSMNIQWYPQLFNSQGRAERVPNVEEKNNCYRERSGCNGHVVLLVGYDSEKDEFIFRNSWGENWGDHGYGYLPRSWIVDHCELCYYSNIPEDLALTLKGIVIDVKSQPELLNNFFYSKLAPI